MKQNKVRAVLLFVERSAHNKQEIPRRTEPADYGREPTDAEPSRRRRPGAWQVGIGIAIAIAIGSDRIRGSGEAD